LEPKPSKRPTAGIILAAGESTRLGKPKQLLKLKDKCLIEWALDAAVASRLKKILLVLGHNHQEILTALGAKSRQPDLEIVINPEYHNGQSTSLLAGLTIIRDTYPSIMFLLGDQPLLDSETINTLLQQFWSSHKDIGVPVYKGRRGNPVIFSQKFYDHLAKIKGDIGARNIVKCHPEYVEEIPINNPHGFMDIDTQSDYDKLVEILTSRRKAR
jgi:molybdenum cofactor cytidylyltransferase